MILLAVRWTATPGTFALFISGPFFTTVGPMVMTPLG
jgi:hypothetical protein